MPPAAAQSQTLQKPILNPNGTPVMDMEAEIKRRVEEQVRELKSSLEVWEIVAPVGDKNHDIWKHLDVNTGKIVNKYNASEAARDGTWEIQIPEHDYYDRETKKTHKVKEQIVAMYSGVARTADRFAALWIEREFGYTIKRIENKDES
jgi:5-hydroxyisourate hydrolase-like protein (transthyretin family)